MVFTGSLTIYFHEFHKQWSFNFSIGFVSVSSKIIHMENFNDSNKITERSDILN